MLNSLYNIFSFLWGKPLNESKNDISFYNLSDYDQNKINAASILQHATRVYLTKNTMANQWVKNQLGWTKRPVVLLNEISEKHITVPSNLSLNLVFKSLIKKGADVNAKYLLGMTPLHLALEFDYFEMAELLIKNGADVNAKGNINMTPLHLALEFDYFEMAELLIKNGADVNAKGNINMTPLHLASFKGNLELAELLIKKGADMNAKTQWGDTPLHWAVRNKHLDLAQLLVEYKADVNIKNCNGEKALY